MDEKQVGVFSSAVLDGILIDSYTLQQVHLGGMNSAIRKAAHSCCLHITIYRVAETEVGTIRFIR